MFVLVATRSRSEPGKTIWRRWPKLDEPKLAVRIAPCCSGDAYLCGSPRPAEEVRKTGVETGIQEDQLRALGAAASTSWPQHPSITHLSFGVNFTVIVVVCARHAIVITCSTPS